VVFVTFGTHHQAFTRLVDALDDLPGDELFVQHGHSPAPRRARAAVPFLGYGEMLEQLQAADKVITHAGVGSILMALREGHNPVVVPRQSRHGEHVDDHQVALTTAHAAQNLVIPLWDTDQLVDAVASAAPRGAPRPPVVGPLHGAVRAALNA
jgi:UDP-N-acetylglucosamine transferase subunit ALG13